MATMGHMHVGRGRFAASHKGVATRSQAEAAAAPVMAIERTVAAAAATSALRPRSPAASTANVSASEAACSLTPSAAVPRIPSSGAPTAATTWRSSRRSFGNGPTGNCWLVVAALVATPFPSPPRNLRSLPRSPRLTPAAFSPSSSSAQRPSSSVSKSDGASMPRSRRAVATAWTSRRPMLVRSPDKSALSAIGSFLRNDRKRTAWPCCCT
mmetsp:Transcript_76990/g.214019  ORF Transcript_76990/g.214019 Transcript_76990/m.214019 type:complete len:211 (+) Transcript_76990:621-1253(+)